MRYHHSNSLIRVATWSLARGLAPFLFSSVETGISIKLYMLRRFSVARPRKQSMWKAYLGETYNFALRFTRWTDPALPKPLTVGFNLPDLSPPHHHHHHQLKVQEFVSHILSVLPFLLVPELASINDPHRRQYKDMGACKTALRRGLLLLPRLTQLRAAQGFNPDKASSRLPQEDAG